MQYQRKRQDTPIKARMVKAAGNVKKFASILGAPLLTMYKWTSETDHPRPWVVEASFDAVALRQATFGWKCKSCGHITEAESEAIRPKYCPSCGHQYFNVCRIVTEKE